MFNFVARSLRIKLLLVFIMMLLAFTSVHLVIRQHWTIPQLIALELEKDRKDIYQLNSALARVFNELEMLVYDNAVWDELYNVVINSDVEYLNENYFIPKSFVSLKINGMSFFDSNQVLIAELAIDQQNTPLVHSPFNVLADPLKNKLLISPKELAANNNKVLFKKGFININGKLVLFMSGSVLPSSGMGELAGTMFVWSYFDSKIEQQLSEIIQAPVTSLSFSQASKVSPLIAFSEVDTVNSIRNEQSNINVIFNDVFNQPALVLSYPKPERMFNDHLFETSMVIALVMSLLILLVIYFILTIMIILPLRKLRSTVKEVMDRGDYKLSTHIERADEIGRLAYLIDILFSKVNVQQTALKRNNRQLKRLSDTDPLTGIANRRAMMQVLAHTTEQDMPISVIMLDIDFFKKYNDHYGHQQGDLAIKSVAKSLKKHVQRKTDIVARYGGEEFAIVLLNTSLHDAQTLASTMCESIEALNIEHQHSSVSSYLTASFGVTSCELFRDFTIETLFHQADNALYKAKEQGRNRVVSFSITPHQHAV